MILLHNVDVLLSLLLPLSLILSSRDGTGGGSGGVAAFASVRTWHTNSRRRSGGIGGGVGGNNGSNPPPPGTTGFCFLDDWEWNGDDLDGNMCMAMVASVLDVSSNEGKESSTKYDDGDDAMDMVMDVDVDMMSVEDISLLLRGGSTETKKHDAISSPTPTNSENTNKTKEKDTELLTKGSKSTLENTISYWTDTLTSLKSTLHSNTNRILPNFLKRTKQPTSDYQSLIDPSTILIQSVNAPNSTLLPPTTLRTAAYHSGLLGATLTTARVQQLAINLKRWYAQRGYVLHAVTGATLDPKDGSVDVAVQEPKVSDVPVAIRFVREVPVDPESGEVTSLRSYRRRWERLRGPTQTRVRRDEWKDAVRRLNVTVVDASRGRTKAGPIARCLDLLPGSHFRWDGERWGNVVKSGIFSKVYDASPRRMEDGTVQIQVTAQEPPPRNLEYGISKSLYTGSWEGELDFSHRNLLGGGEKLGLVVRRGTKDKEASVKIRLTDDRFGSGGGYNVELFNDYISTDDPPDNDDGNADTATKTTPFIPRADKIIYDQEDPLLCRKGLTYNLRNPIPRTYVRQSTSSISLERTSTRNGLHESIGSVALDLGPFHTDLPLGSRANVATRVTSGTRIADFSGGGVGSGDSESGSSSDSSWCLLPYASGTATTRQIFPILKETGRGITLALHHSMFTSTQNLPRHEANAAGFAAKVRGYTGSSNEPICSSTVGQPGARIPITLPIVGKDAIVQDASLVVFGDWMIALRRRQQQGGGRGGRRDRVLRGEGTGGGGWEELGSRQSCFGIGLRKTLQGIPVKYDISYDTKNAKIGATFGLGVDWDI